jgi:uncharacterized protein YndB with AHSA1/START domain
MIEPVVLEIDVACTLDDAFRTFTERIHEWWPVGHHSLGQERVVLVAFEPVLGGRLFERWDDGTERGWGVIDVWDPPRRLVFSWQLNAEQPAATEVEVTFTAEGDRTRVRLEHRHWHRLGAGGPAARASYDAGWPRVVGKYEAYVSGVTANRSL